MSAKDVYKKAIKQFAAASACKGTKEKVSGIVRYKGKFYAMNIEEVEQPPQNIPRPKA
jgi:hypothetical protein